jgi:iron complex transport system permease protein
MSLSSPRILESSSRGLRIGAWCGLLVAVLLLVVVASSRVGGVDITYGTVLLILLDAVAIPVPGLSGEGVTLLGLSLPGLELAWYSPFSFDVADSDRVIVLQLRMPRIVLGGVVGFSLATAGAVMQGFFRNPMADPSIIGVSSGAAVGAVAVLVAPISIPLGLPAAAFVGAVLAAFGVYLIATEGGRTPVATLLLAGVALQTFLGAVVSFMLVQSGRSLREAVYWLMGHLQHSTWDKVLIAGPVALVCFVVLFAHARDLNVLLLGEEDAASLGVEVERTKRILLAVSAVLTGAAVAVSGIIGFVGLIVPHVLRLVVGPDHRILLPTSALAGAAFLVATDTVARSGAYELPVGIVTAFLGAPFFLYLLRKREVHEL